MIKSSELFKNSDGSDFTGPILLHMIDSNGYGDVSLAIKVTKFLINKYPNAEIKLVGEKSSFVKLSELEPNFLNKKVYPQITTCNPDKKLSNNAKLEIETAICNSSLNNAPNSSHSKIFIGEYGCYEQNPYKPPIISLSGNVGKMQNSDENFPGILIEPDLEKFSRLGEEAKKQARINIFENKSFSTDQLLKVQMLKREGDAKTFIETGSCAYSYFNNAMAYKQTAIVFAASNDKKHANYFISAAANANKDQIIKEILQEDNFKSELKKLGYSKLVFYDVNSEKSLDFVLNEDQNGREFRIFHRHRFDQDLALDLMRLSDVCGVAGDQSLTEAISLGIVPIAERWHCQIIINMQIANTYYDKTPMMDVFLNTWNKMNDADMPKWVDAGKTIRSERQAISVVLRRIQEEANLYNALEYTLNLQFEKSQQEKITQYNKSFIDVLARYTNELKGEKKKVFHIVTQVACYNARYKPHMPLSMHQLVRMIDINLDKKISHIPTICNYLIKSNFGHLIRDDESHNFLKKLTHQPSGNKQLKDELDKLHRVFWGTTDETWLQEKKSYESNLNLPM